MANEKPWSSSWQVHKDIQYVIWPALETYSFIHSSKKLSVSKLPQMKNKHTFQIDSVSLTNTHPQRLNIIYILHVLNYCLSTGSSKLHMLHILFHFRKGLRIKKKDYVSFSHFLFNGTLVKSSNSYENWLINLLWCSCVLKCRKKMSKRKVRKSLCS